MRAGRWIAAGTALFLYLGSFRDGSLIYNFFRGEAGVWIDEGDRIARGEVMYRDFFEFLAPGTPYLNAAVIVLFGRRIAAFGYLAIAIGTILAWLLYALSARAVGPRYRTIPPVVFIVLVHASFAAGNHKWPALAAGLGGVLLLARSTHASASLAAGALLGTSALFTQDFGTGMAGGALLYLLVGADRSLRRAGALASGFLASTGVVMSYFVAKAGLSTVVFDCLVFPLTLYREENVFRVDLLRHLGPRTQAQLALCALGIASGVYFAVARRDGDSTSRLVSFVGLGLIVVTIHRPLTPVVAAIRCTPLLIPLARSMELLGRSRSAPLRWAHLATLTLLAIGVGWGGLSLVAQKQWIDPMILETHRAGQVWVRSPLSEVSWIEAETREGEAVFLLPIKGGLYFLSGTRSVVSVPYLMATKNTAEQIRQVASEIESRGPRVGAWEHASGLSEVYAAIARHYDVAGVVPQGGILLRRKTP